jgi:hypothetical protein
MGMVFPRVIATITVVALAFIVMATYDWFAVLPAEAVWLVIFSSLIVAIVALPLTKALQR